MGSVSPVHQSIVLETKGGGIMVRELDSGPDGLWPLSPTANCCWCLETGTSLVCVWGASQTHGCGLCRWSTMFVMSELCVSYRKDLHQLQHFLLAPTCTENPTHVQLNCATDGRFQHLSGLYGRLHVQYLIISNSNVSSRCISAVIIDIIDWVNYDFFINKSPFKSWLFCFAEGVYSRPVTLKSSKHDLLQ